MQDLAVGVDLGNCTSKIAYYDAECQQPKLIDDPDTGSPLVPSLVAATPFDDILIGERARLLAADPTCCEAEIKRKLGSEPAMTLAGKPYSPEKLAACILRKLGDMAAGRFGVRALHAVVAIPRSTIENEGVRLAYLNATQEAGLNLLGLVSESAAAAISCGLGASADKDITIVLDIGAYSLEISLFESAVGELDLNAWTSLGGIGGQSFNKGLEELVLDKILNIHYDAKIDDNAVAVLARTSELVKAQLSFRPSYRTSVQGFTTPRGSIVDLDVDISRDEFECATARAMDSARQQITQALASMGLQTGRPVRLILSGGPANMPCFRRMIEDVFGTTACDQVMPDHAVALGAAVYAGILGGIVPVTREHALSSRSFHVAPAPRRIQGSSIYDRSLYETLGVPPKADNGRILYAGFLKLLESEVHGDPIKSRAIRHALTILTDPEARIEHDRDWLPDSARISKKQAISLMLDGDCTGPRVTLDLILRDDQNSLVARTLLGCCLMENHDWEAADAHFTQPLSRDPKNFRNLWWAGMYFLCRARNAQQHEKQRMLELARYQFEQMHYLEKIDPKPRLAIAEICLGQGKLKEAVQWAGDVLTISRKIDPVSFLTVIETLCKLACKGWLEQTAKLASQLKSAVPDNGCIGLLIAELLQRRCERKMQREFDPGLQLSSCKVIESFLTAALLFDPDSSNIKERLGRIQCLAKALLEVPDLLNDRRMVQPIKELAMQHMEQEEEEILREWFAIRKAARPIRPMSVTEREVQQVFTLKMEKSRDVESGVVRLFTVYPRIGNLNREKWGGYLKDVRSAYTGTAKVKYVSPIVKEDSGKPKSPSRPDESEPRHRRRPKRKRQ